jgi:hypothetical protein
MFLTDPIDLSNSLTVSINNIWNYTLLWMSFNRIGRPFVLLDQSHDASTDMLISSSVSIVRSSIVLVVSEPLYHIEPDGVSRGINPHDRASLCDILLLPFLKFCKPQLATCLIRTMFMVLD